MGSSVPEQHLPTSPEADRICSARGCQQPASFDLAWNNPKIHTPDRRKHWLACPDHHDRLVSFLNTRGFLREVNQLSTEP
jgi:hypothetical protein